MQQEQLGTPASPCTDFPLQTDSLEIFTLDTSGFCVTKCGAALLEITSGMLSAVLPSLLCLVGADPDQPFAKELPTATNLTRCLR